MLNDGSQAAYRKLRGKRAESVRKTFGKVSLCLAKSMWEEKFFSLSWCSTFQHGLKEFFANCKKGTANRIQRTCLSEKSKHHWNCSFSWGGLGVVSKLPAAFPSPKLNRSFRVYHISCYWMHIQVDPTSSNLASAMLNSKIRPRAVVGYGGKIFHPSPPNYVTTSPGRC